ncbi:hypothetical protein CDIK_4134, partial [Cucumispora dikerogammari]
MPENTDTLQTRNYSLIQDKNRNKSKTTTQSHKTIQKTIEIPSWELGGEKRNQVFFDSIFYKLPINETPPKVLTSLVFFFIVVTFVFNLAARQLYIFLNLKRLTGHIIKDLIDLVRSVVCALCIMNTVIYFGQYMFKPLHFTLYKNRVLIFLTFTTIAFKLIISTEITIIITPLNNAFIKPFINIRENKYFVEKLAYVFIVSLIAIFINDMIYYTHFYKFYQNKIKRINEIRNLILFLDRPASSTKKKFFKNALKTLKEYLSLRTRAKKPYLIEEEVFNNLILFIQKDDESGFVSYLNEIILEIQRFPFILKAAEDRHIFIFLPILLTLFYTIYYIINFRVKSSISPVIFLSLAPLLYIVLQNQIVSLFYSYLFCYNERYFDIKDTVYIGTKLYKCVSISPFLTEFICEGKHVILPNSEYIQKPYIIKMKKQANTELEWKYLFDFMKSFNKIIYLKSAIKSFFKKNEMFFLENFSLDLIHTKDDKCELYIKF